MSRRAPALTLVLLALVGAGIAGCGAVPGLTPAAPGRVHASVYTTGGEARIVVKRRSATPKAYAGLKRIRAIAPLRVEILGVPVGRLDAALATLRQDPAVSYAEPAQRVRASSDFRRTDDPLFERQYAPQRVQAPAAWPQSKGAGVTVAVVDTGVDLGHPEFAGRLAAGYNVVAPGAPARDDNGHGTHVAGIVAAAQGNGAGIVGIAPEATIMPIKVLEADGSGSDAGVAEGMVWAVDHGAQVLNLSLGGPGEAEVLREAVAYALARGVAVVAAMGNNGSDEQCFPAGYPGVIAVGATDEQDRVAGFSQYGDWISVTAPGVAVLSTFPTYEVVLNHYGFAREYAALDGTSQATPQVAGVAALVLARQRGLAPARLKALLEASSDRLPGQGGFDPHLGHGRINALRAVR